MFQTVRGVTIRKRKVAVVRYIGDCLGAWLDVEDIARDISWYDTIRVRINLNITVPLKHALRLRSEHGDEVVVRFSYERLPNFCYLCSKLGHIGQLCDLRFSENFEDPGSKTPYGAWLRASGPIRRFGVLSNSVRPTYIWRGASTSELSETRRRGAQIFGDFRRDNLGSVEPVAAAGGGSTGIPAFQERLDNLPGRLEKTCKPKPVVRTRRLVDQDSDSIDLHVGPTECCRPAHFSSGPAHFYSTHSISEESVGSSLGLVDIWPNAITGPSAMAQPIPSLTAISPHSQKISDIPGSGEFEVGGPSVRAFSPTSQRQIPVGDAQLATTVCASSSVPLVEVPISVSLEFVGEGGRVASGGSVLRGSGWRGRGHRGQRRGRPCGRAGGVGLSESPLATVMFVKEYLSSYHQACLLYKS
ncbi:hypothetical protein Salat_1433000 [Sesamum alatum]|uniref:Zinc knuckle CX2CX4HX4C domain-containing protein n=1 Tax=Sesamum alatum TaxID=300844 RepID=A0AAE1YBM5_9LAMI|nr:hypothetical protein Salat_1433000 [Sesamum alatum]